MVCTTGEKREVVNPGIPILPSKRPLTLSCVFGMRLRQTEGLVNSVFDLMGLDIPVPDRRAQKWKLSARPNPPLPDGPLHVLVDSTGL